MTPPAVRLLPEARIDFDEAADWYESQRVGLGVRFIAQVREALERIARRPRIHPVVYRDVRKAVLRRFPFIVLYREEAGEILVISIFHISRDPSVWHGRS